MDVDGSRVAAGAWLADTLNGNQIIDGGAVYVYERDSPITATKEFLRPNGRTVLNNPSIDGKLILHNRDETSAETSLQIFSLQGELVFDKGHLEGSDYEADFSHFPAGVYFVQINRDGYLPETLKWIKL